MMSFIHNWSEIRTWMAIASNNKRHKFRRNNFKITTFLVLNFKLKIIRLPQDTCTPTPLICTPTPWNNCFYSYIYEKRYSAVHFTKKGVCFVNLLTEKLWVYYLLAEDTSQVYIFSLHKIKLSKNVDYLSSKLSLTYRVNVSHYQNFHILHIFTVFSLPV